MDTLQHDAPTPTVSRPRSTRACVAALACVSLATVACSGQELEQQNLGSTFVGQSSAGAGDPNERSSLIRDDGFINAFIAGHWVGEAEDLFSPAGPDGQRPSYVFPSGSSQITLDLWLPDGTNPEGQIVFGAGEVPAPAPGVVYPPGLGAHLDGIFTLLDPDLRLPPIEGFTYPLSEAVLRTTADEGAAAGTLAMGYAPNAGYADWCALQPANNRGGVYDCLTPSAPDDPNARCSRSYLSGATEHYDCRLGALCSNRDVCSCTQDGCVEASVSAVQLWLVRSGDDIVGTLVDAVFAYPRGARFMPIGSIRFQRGVPYIRVSGTYSERSPSETSRR
jgi:hypothetical protein